MIFRTLSVGLVAMFFLIQSAQGDSKKVVAPASTHVECPSISLISAGISDPKGWSATVAQSTSVAATMTTGEVRSLPNGVSLTCIASQTGRQTVILKRLYPTVKETLPDGKTKTIGFRDCKGNGSRFDCIQDITISENTTSAAPITPGTARTRAGSPK